MCRMVLVAVVLLGRDAGAATSNDTWQSFPLDAQSGTFEAFIEATPNGPAIDGVVGIASGPVSDFYDDLAVIVRFNDAGTIDARDDDAYTADVRLSYTAGTDYTFRLAIDVPAHLYSVWVTPEGGSEVALAVDYAFRTEQATASSLGNWGTTSSFGTMEVEVTLDDPGEPTDPNGYTGAAAAGCTSDQYYDFTTETCVTPEEQGCAAARGVPLVVLLLLRRRR